jgi:arylsulfatase
MKTKTLVNTFAVCAATLTLFSTGSPASAADKKPNILIIWGDDIGYWDGK